MCRSIVYGVMVVWISICFPAFAQIARAHYMDWYAGGVSSALMEIKVQTSLERTIITFDESGDPGQRHQQIFKVLGEEMGVYTANESFALFTSNPGVGMTVFRRKGNSIIRALECRGPYQPEIGNSWAMCFSGTATSGNIIYPDIATIYLLSVNQAFVAVSRVKYQDRYTELAGLLRK